MTHRYKPCYLSTKKRRKKEKEKSTQKKLGATSNASDPEQREQDGYPYDYNFLLKRVYSMLHRDYPSLQETKSATRLKIPPLNMCRYKTTRSCWSNFIPVCQAMHRPADHLVQFLEKEMAIHLSVNGRQHLIIPTRLETRGLASLLDRYVKQYVLCMRCNSATTIMTKDTVRRLTQIKCTNCHATTTAPPIKKHQMGHRALKKGDRSKFAVESKHFNLYVSYCVCIFLLKK